ncbi:MAG TPA: peptidoglycan DD-metalloendopeptidase family protein [Longimicrobiales bacterium]|nr:peptidoglycan DD-metalloendopeptidase family protein [Longimicrobiales bacterium]
MRTSSRLLPVLLALSVAACTSGGGGPPARRPTGPTAQSLPPAPPPLPDTSLWGTQTLVVARAADTAVWVGTYGRGIFVQRKGAKEWENVVPRANDSTSLSWPYVNALGLTKTAVWYGTVGNGFGRSTDGGKTWRNFGSKELGAEWQYVAPDGIRTHGDTVYIATADGLRITWDGGTTWRCVRGPKVEGDAAPPGTARCAEDIRTLPSEYLLSLDVGPDGSIWVGHLKGVSVSRDGGATWASPSGVPQTRIRALLVGPDSTVWTASEDSFYRAPSLKGEFKSWAVNLPGWPALPGGPRAFIPSPYRRPPGVATSHGLVLFEPDSTYHVYFGSGEQYHPASDLWDGTWGVGRLLPITASDIGLMSLLPIRPRPWDLVDAPNAGAPAVPRHAWFRRPIEAAEGNPYIDATYRYGSTMGGQFQQHQGVEFNNPQGTPVHAIADGVVVFAGKAEAGANTVAIRHDQGWEGRNVFSVYYHNTSLNVRSGDRVRAGDVVARVGNTGRATNEHLHLEVHVAQTADSSKIVDAQERFPANTVNPQLWIEPIPGTGVVAGRVLDASGAAVPGARVYGLVLAYPEETPFAFAETYQDKAHPDPAYNENFAVGDVPPGRYLLGVDYQGQVTWRTVDVEAGRVTFVEFRPKGGA